jgi:eukaryotic-like serine/threonine-protein kinase
VTKASLSYIGPYRLLNVVNTSQTGQIWQAYDDGKQQIVGIKTLLEKFRKSREHVGYLRWEYKVSRTVVHPRILNIFAFDIDRGAPYVVMEWFPAPNLKQRIQQGTGKLAHLMPRIIEQAAEAVGYFNLCGWVHRDIKPDNFLLADNGDLKLIDFSLAQRSRGLLARWFARRSKVQGTRSYMSPEQIRGEVLDQRADVYSLGCVIHELITGKPPFTGSTEKELLNKHLRTAPPSLDPIEHNVTPEFAQLLRRTLAKDPAGRPASMDDFLAEVRRHRVFRIMARPPEEAAKRGLK